MGIADSWGINSRERELVFPCDNFIKEYDPACTLYRGITIEAPISTVFKWVSQLRIAPYSYDWIDNHGRPSPNRLLPDLPPLETGQIVWNIFELIDFEMDRSLTLRATPAGLKKYQLQDLVVSYLIYPQDNQTCRLLVKGLMKYQNNLAGRLVKCLMPGLDLIMMRKQFLRLKMLAEQQGEEQ